ncbi:hypothetical protein EGH25_04015 [Haladaptatus sp. F3-133]|jgi:hypothetical protein|uniref:Uncharacterized protein n=1 Tax=Halorutilus salinus TaxID=2487751 RepID=A0A9Q4C258_9EURY|nr:hypothetical protein [Halorutilus salinus]MCX2818520.1 hypothetical protein [Halorutilus salinus]
MEFDEKITAGLFVVLIAAGVGALVGMQVMPTDIVLMMVAPSMAIFGAVMVAIGVKHGEYRAAG